MSKGIRINGIEVDMPKHPYKKYRALKKFWMAPYMHLYEGDVVDVESVVRFGYKAERVIYMPCGYDPSSDVEAEMSYEQINSLIDNKYIEELDFDSSISYPIDHKFQQKQIKHTFIFNIIKSISSFINKKR